MLYFARSFGAWFIGLSVAFSIIWFALSGLAFLHDRFGVFAAIASSVIFGAAAGAVLQLIMRRGYLSK